MDADAFRKRGRSGDQPAPPPVPQGPQTYGAGDAADDAELGSFRPGSPFSQWALARYLVGRALTESLGRILLVAGVVLLIVAALAQWLLSSTLLAVLFVVLALGVLVLRWLLLAVVRRLTGWRQFAPIEQRMGALVSDTRSDVFAELRRVGLPGRLWTLPLLAVRLLRRRTRAETVARLRRFDVGRAVPKFRLDELHLLMRAVLSGGSPPKRTGP